MSSLIKELLEIAKDYKWTIKWKARKNDRLKCATYDNFEMAVKKFKSEIWDNVYVEAVRSDGDVYAIFNRFANGNKNPLVSYSPWFDYDVSLLDD